MIKTNILSHAEQTKDQLNQYLKTDNILLLNTSPLHREQLNNSMKYSDFDWLNKDEFHGKKMCTTWLHTNHYWSDMFLGCEGWEWERYGTCIYVNCPNSLNDKNNMNKLYMGRDARKPVFEFLTKWDSNRPAKLQRLVWKFARSKFRYDTFQ